MSFDEVGRGFVTQYYATVGSQRQSLAGIYRPTTLMTWSGKQMQGVDAIMANMAALTFGNAEFRMEEMDCHPSVSGGVLVVVQGEVLIQGEQHSLKFNDVFHLAQENGQWIVTNQVFRILGGGAH